MDSLFRYAQWIELETFFSGYVLVYALIYLIAVNINSTSLIKSRVLPRLPLAYALVATMFWGLQLKNEYPDFTLGNFYSPNAGYPWLLAWGALSILFWIPALRKKHVFTLLHSFVFFVLLMRDLYLQTSGAGSDESLRNNDLKIFSASVGLNIVSLLATLTFFYFSRHFKRIKNLPPNRLL
jgi:hypothetical protein